MEQEGVEGDGCAIGLSDDASFVMPVDFVLFQLAQVFLGGIDAVHLAQLPVHGKAVHPDGVGLVDFGFKRGDILVDHVGVGIDLAAGSGVERACVAGNEVLVGGVVEILIDSQGCSSFL